MNEAYRRVAAVTGIATLVGGVLAVTGIAVGDVPVPMAVLYAAGGVLITAMGYLLYREWLPGHDFEPPAVERASAYAAPGDDFDRTLAQFETRGRGHLPDRKAIHDRLRELAAEVLERQEGVHDEAMASIEAGDWPGDPMVGSFLEDPHVQLPRSWSDRARRLVGSTDEPSDFQRLVSRTVDELATRSKLVETAAESDSRIVRGTGVGRGRIRTSNLEGRTRPEVSTGRWRTVVPVALGLVGVGFVFQRVAVVLAGGVALGFAVYARASVAPSPSLAVERSLDTEQLSPGDEVEVTVTLRNEGEHTIPDLRVVDGVPSSLSVTEGSPRYGTALRPQESASFTYAVTARRGVHDFDPTYVVLRDYAGATGHERLVPVTDTSDGALACVPDLDRLAVPVPLYEQSGEYLGRIPAEAGEGVEFHATREYRPGDPISRIDWKRLARSANDDFTTVQFREERAATVALVVDALPAAYLAPEPDGTAGIERSLEAAGGLVDSLLETGDRVGVAALGPTPSWVRPGTGIDHRRRVREVLAADSAFPPTAPRDDNFPVHWVREFHRRFPAESQVVLLSPLCDRRYHFVIRRLQAYGHPVTVVSPDPTTDGTVGQRLVRLERRFRIERLREAGVRVIDWKPGDDLAVALTQAGERWSR